MLNKTEQPDKRRFVIFDCVVIFVCYCVVIFVCVVLLVCIILIFQFLEVFLPFAFLRRGCTIVHFLFAVAYLA